MRLFFDDKYLDTAIEHFSDPERIKEFFKEFLKEYREIEMLCES